MGSVVVLVAADRAAPAGDLATAAELARDLSS
jgi:hypothetical protein